jgi:3-dehydroquinate synthase
MLKAERQGKSLISEGLEEFREHLGGALSVTLLSSIGEGIEVTDMDLDTIARSIAWLEANQG